MAKKYSLKGKKGRQRMRVATRIYKKGRKETLAKRSLPEWRKGLRADQIFESRVTQRAERAGKFDPPGKKGSQKQWIRRLNIARRKTSARATKTKAGPAKYMMKKRWN